MEILKKDSEDNSELNKKIQQDVENVASGNFNKIYPILKPGDWIGTKTSTLKHILVGSQDDPKIVVAFGYDAPNSFVFLMSQDLKDKSQEQVFQEAFDNLEAVVSDFEVLDSLQGKVLAASGHSFASEKILCKNHLLKAHELLQAKELLVSIPRRTCMMITDRQVDKNILNQFIYLHNYTWEDDNYGNAPIFNGFFVIIDGEITSVIPFDK
ncbi:MAG: hypothetical protein MUC49_14215 [Raineya sp.]|jgi:hypothetical protein|nr:hypothetical protein [Raineya sp.]